MQRAVRAWVSNHRFRADDADPGGTFLRGDSRRTGYPQRWPVELNREYRRSQPRQQSAAFALHLRTVAPMRLPDREWVFLQRRGLGRAPSGSRLPPARKEPDAHPNPQVRSSLRLHSPLPALRFVTGCSFRAESTGLTLKQHCLSLLLEPLLQEEP